MRCVRHLRRSIRLRFCVLFLPVVLCTCDYISPTEPRVRCVTPATPRISFTSVPRIGSSDVVKGTVDFQNTPCDAQDYRVALYVSFDGVGGICKPYETDPLTPISKDGYWEASYDTGGIDEQAPWIFALLVKREFVSSCFTSSIPEVDGATVLARVSRHRT